MPELEVSPLAVSVVVPVHNNAPTIGRVAQEFLRQLDLLADGELIVVDDGSTDGPDRALATVLGHPRLSVLRSEVNRGAAAARNRGADAARGRILVFSDGDCIPSESFVAAHLAAHRQHPDERWVVLGNLRYPPEVTVTPLMRLGNVVEFWGGRTSFAPADAAEVPEGQSSDFTLFRTTNISLKRRFLTVRFSEEMGATSGWEDIDVGLRLAAQGMVVVATREAVSWHYHFLDPRQYLEKAFRYGALFRHWLRLVDPGVRLDLLARLSFHLDSRRWLSRANLLKLRKRLVVNAITFHPLWGLARRLEGRSERLSAALYWKLYPHVFLRGYDRRPIAGLIAKNPTLPD